MVDEPVDFAREIGHQFVLPSTLTVDGVRWFSPGPLPSASPDSLFYESWILATIYEVGSEQEYGTPRQAGTTISGGSTTGTIMGNTIFGVPAVTIPEALGQLDQAFIRLTTGQIIRSQFSGYQFLTSQPRILNVTYDVYAAPLVTGSANLVFGFRTIAGIVFELAEVTHTQSAGGRVYSWSTGEIFQAAYDWIVSFADDRRRPWLMNDLADLTSGDVEFYIRNDGPQTVDINWVAMTIDYCTENRVAVGGQERGARHLNFTYANNTWQDGIELVNPVTAATGVTLLQGRQYALTLTRASDSYLPEQVLVQNNSPRYQSGLARNIQTLAGADGYPLRSVEYLRDTSGLIISDATVLDRGYALGLEAAGSSDTIPWATNPYSFASDLDLASIQQEVTTTTTAMYRSVRLTTRKIGQPADLVVTIGTSTASISSDDFDELAHDANGWATVTLQLSEPVVVQANANTTITVNKGIGSNRWEVPVLFTQAAFFDGNDLSVSTYGSNAQRGTGAFGMNNDVDYAITLLTPAPAVTGLSVEGITTELTPIDPVCPAPGRITELEYANICWGNVPIVSGSAYSMGYVLFPGEASDYVWAPDAAPLDITGDLTLIARVAPDDWTPSVAQAIIAKFDVSGGINQRSYMLRIGSTGGLEFIWSTDGTVANQKTALSNNTIGDLAPGSVRWIASTIDVNNGAGGNTVRFWYADDTLSWTQLGTDVVQAGATSIFNSTSRLTLGCHSAGTGSLYTGKISNAIVASGIGAGGLPGGTNVFNMLDTNIPSNVAGSFVVSTGQTLTVSRSGSPATFLQQGQTVMITGGPDQNNFCAWEVERREDGGDWQTFARITQRENRCVQDYEGVFGTSTDYRVRLCRLDGVCGEWAVVTGFVRNAPPGCDGLIFTSNEKPSSTLAYPMSFEDSPEEDFTFYEADTVVLERLHMRDYMVAFRPLERGGVRFQRTMLVNAVSVPPEILDDGFDDLRDLAWDTLSYVAVLDTRGAKWYAAVIVPSGSIRWTRQLYFAAVDIVETTNKSSIIDVRSA